MEQAEIELKKWGNSQGIILPKKVCQLLGIKIGSVLDVTTNNGTIFIKPKNNHKSYTIPTNFKLKQK